MTGHFTSYENRTDHELATKVHLILADRQDAAYIRGMLP